MADSATTAHYSHANQAIYYAQEIHGPCCRRRPCRTARIELQGFESQDSSCKNNIIDSSGGTRVKQALLKIKQAIASRLHQYTQAPKHMDIDASAVTSCAAGIRLLLRLLNMTRSLTFPHHRRSRDATAAQTQNSQSVAPGPLCSRAPDAAAAAQTPPLSHSQYHPLPFTRSHMLWLRLGSVRCGAACCGSSLVTSSCHGAGPAVLMSSPPRRR